ncbi:family 43 putative glycoside hydrolase [Podospora fimiseda]|uniref:Family 43 putative glycoside hydrolase n=1 Tax=Podospora fimiseda TaxID=252190 RepID=A0AAN7BRP0_9PEZI|nr:family 43 putative glycoside hydrolase [Podospora fimiseda]
MLPLLFVSLSLPLLTSAKTPKSPLLQTDFPDPCIIHHPTNNTYYAFATSSNQKNIQAASAPSASGPWTWLSSVDPLPDPGPWTSGPRNYGMTWAPSVISLPDSSGWVMYYSAQLPANSSAFHCVGAAVSKMSILGPYEPLPSPLACPLSKGGAIDPSGFFDPQTGKRYLVYKVDGNSLGNGGSCGNTIAPLRNTPIMLQRVNETDGVTLIGEPVEILDRDERDGPLVEAPDLWWDGKRHVLFYSNHCWSEEGYSVNYAVSTDGVEGEYVKMNGTNGGERALVMTEGIGDGFNLSAPGGATSFWDEEKGESGIVLHANCREGRCLFGVGIGVDEDGRVYVD